MASISPAAQSCRSQTVKISERRGVGLRLRNGIYIYFGADPEKVFYKCLLARGIKLVELPQRIELHGPGRVLGWTTAEIVKQVAGDRRRVNAEELFHVLSRVRRENACEATGLAYISYANKQFKLPIARSARFGPAAREERITALVLPDRDGHRRIHFYERLPDGSEQHINWLPLDTPVRSEVDPAVYLADHLEEFRLKDIPVRIKHGKAFILYRGVTITFSVDADSRYYSDLAGGRLFVRAGRAERIEAVSKSGAKTRVLGPIAIKDSCLIVGDRRIRLDHPEDGSSFSIEEAIEELGGREVKLEPGKLVHALSLRLPFPKNVGNFYGPRLRAGQIRCVIYRDKLKVGYRDLSRFTEIGRALGNEVVRNGKRQPRADLVELVPELAFSLDLDPGDRYYDDQLKGNLLVRTAKGRYECCAVRPEGIEFIGSADRTATNDLASLFPALKSGTADNCTGLNLIKRQALLLAAAVQPGGPETLKLYAELSRGLKWLNQGAELSADLKAVFAREIQAALFPWRALYLTSRLGSVRPVAFELPEIVEPDFADSLGELDLK